MDDIQFIVWSIAGACFYFWIGLWLVRASMRARPELEYTDSGCWIVMILWPIVLTIVTFVAFRDAGKKLSDK